MPFYRKMVVVASLLLSCHSAFAQNCKWKESKQDPISEQKFLRSKSVKMFAGHKFGQSETISLDVHLELENGKVFLYAAFQRGSYMSDEKVAAPVLTARLEDKTLITLNSAESFSTKLTVPGITDIAFRFPVAKADVIAFGKSVPGAFKLSFSGQDFLFEPKERRADDIREIFACMSAEMGSGQ